MEYCTECHRKGHTAHIAQVTITTRNSHIAAVQTWKSELPQHTKRYRNSCNRSLTEVCTSECPRGKSCLADAILVVCVSTPFHNSISPLTLPSLHTALRPRSTAEMPTYRRSHACTGLLIRYGQSQRRAAERVFVPSSMSLEIAVALRHTGEHNPPHYAPSHLPDSTSASSCHLFAHPMPRAAARPAATLQHAFCLYLHFLTWRRGTATKIACPRLGATKTSNAALGPAWSPNFGTTTSA